MEGFRNLLRGNPLAIGLILMFVLTWPIDLAHAGVLPFEVPFAIYITLGWGFVYAALMMTGLISGRSGVIALLKRYLIWRVNWTWYLVALFLYPSLFCVAVALNGWWTQQSVDFSTVMAHNIFGSEANLALYIVPFFFFEAVTNGEEIGWRGYVLPRLQARHSALVASLILGVIWGLWHLPKFMNPEGSHSLALFLVKTLADAVLYTWLYNSTGGSLLLVTILHAAGNTAGIFLPIANTASTANLNALIFFVALDILVAVVVILASGPAQLNKAMLKQVQN